MSAPVRQSRSAVIRPPAAWRFWVVAAVLTLLGLVLVWRLLSLQVLSLGERDYHFLQKQGDARALRTLPLPAYRGMISDRHGQPLAVSAPVKTLWAQPETLAAHPEHWPSLAAALGMPLADFRRRLASAPGRGFMYLRRHMNPAEADRVLALAVPGVSALTEYRRYYPAREVVAHLVGFTDVDDQGREGIELSFDALLRGEPGAKRVVRNERNRIIADLGLVRAARPGQDLRLTIDLRLQYIAYRELSAAIARAGAQSGSVIVLDSRSGEILAMVNAPSYNPNDTASRGRPALMRNRAMIDLMEPGSTTKPFTMVAALESGRYRPDTPINTAPGYIVVQGGKKFEDFRNYGMLDLTGVLAKSSQVGTTRIALDLDPLAIRGVLERVGLGQVSGIGFPGEATGALPNLRRWSDVERASMAFGYGFAVTPLQLAQAYAVLANGGRHRPLSLVQGSVLPPSEQVIAPDVNAAIVGMLGAVTQAGGTATRAAVPGYSVAGKTGTVRRVGAGGYEKRYTALFAGMVPASDPRLVAVVVIHEPQGLDYGGGAVAAPVFSRIMADSLRLTGLAPDAVEAARVVQWPAAAAGPRA